MSASYAVNDIGEGARKLIRDLNGSLGSRHFPHVMNERTSFASWASAFKNLTKTLQMFLSRLNEISGGCDKLVPVSGSFWSNLKFIRSLITDHYKLFKAVQHRQMKNWPVLWSQLSTIPWKSWFSHSFVIREMLIHIFIAYHNKSCCQLTFETTDKPVF